MAVELVPVPARLADLGGGAGTSGSRWPPFRGPFQVRRRHVMRRYPNEASGGAGARKAGDKLGREGVWAILRIFPRSSTCISVATYIFIRDNDKY